MRSTLFFQNFLKGPLCQHFYKYNNNKLKFISKRSYTSTIKSFREKCSNIQTNYTFPQYIDLLNEVKHINDNKIKNDLEIDFFDLSSKASSDLNSIEDLSNLLNQYIELDWRSSARDLLPSISTKLLSSEGDSSKDAQNVKIAVNILELISQIKLLDARIIDFITKNVKLIEDSDLAKVVLSVSKYGLRGKHILDELYRECLARANRLGTTDTMLILEGLSDFAIDYTDFFKSQINKLSRNIDNISDADRRLLLNISRALHHDHSYELLRDAISKYLLNNVDRYTIDYLISVIPYLSKGSKSKSSRALVCQTLIKLFNDETQLQSCSVEQLSDILESVAWWKIRSNLINRILSILSTRVSEIKNAKNLGLFTEIYNSINNMSWFHHSFMVSSSQFVKDPNLMSRISPVQFTRVLQTFNKIRYYDKESYESMFEYITNDFNGLSSRINQISDVLFSGADANVKADYFYKKAAAFVYDFFRKVPKDADNMTLLNYLQSNRVWPRDIANLAWSLTVLNYHKDPDFISLFKLLLIPEIVTSLTPFEVELVLYTSEACIIECSDMPKLMLIAQDMLEIYNKQLQQIRIEQEQLLSESRDDEARDDRGVQNRTYEAKDGWRAPIRSRHQTIYYELHLRGRIRASRQIQSTLKHMGIGDVLFRVAPHYSSPYVIDVCFSKQNKKGIVILGGNFLMRDSVSGDWNYTNTGLAILQRRVLAAQKWKIFEIGCSIWSQIDNLEEKRELMYKALEHLDIKVPDL